jgi:Sulfatase
MRRFVAAALAFLYFDALFTFENVPSTPSMRFVPKVSIEVLALVGLLALLRLSGLRLARSRLARGLLALGVFLAALVRYVDTTSVGVLGRPFDLYGDAPHLHRVAAMFLEGLKEMAPGLVVVLVGVLLLVVLAALVVNWLALGAIDRALEGERLRFAALVGAGVGAVFFFVAPGKTFATTVTSIVARQIASLGVGKTTEIAAAAIDFPPQHLTSSLEKLHGANVILIFVESYGVTLIEDKKHFDVMEPRYRALEASLSRAGYYFSSSQILSPTFGGGSWRAHATLLSGFQAESEHLYDALLASKRKTLVHLLKAKGYRTVAAEPGIKWYWPDGLFYEFDKIYDFDALGYKGPPIGWWKIPDQFTLYRIYENEIRDARQPVFAKFSLIMTHIPYFPVPQYVPDWTRFDDGTAYRTGLKSVSHDAYRDLMELSSWYLAAVGYELDVLEGFLEKYVPDNSLVIIVGDHQPPKLATHDNDSWAVPMHVLSKREDLVRAFDALGFEEGLVPLKPSSLRMADFLEDFLQIYDGSETD